MTRYPRVQFYQSGLLRRWRWRVRAGNGEIVCQGQAYRDERDARRGFADAREAMAAVEWIER